MTHQDAHPPVDTETSRVRGIYDAMAPRYDRMIAIAERLLFSDGRRWACTQAGGRVLEVAIGTGRNLSCYPDDVQLTGVELSPSMLTQAQARAETLHRAVDLRLGDAQHLSFPDASFDTVVATLTLCSIPDDRAAVAEMGGEPEMARVLRPGGRLVLLDHVASPLRWVRAVQRLLDPRWSASKATTCSANPTPPSAPPDWPSTNSPDQSGASSYDSLPTSRPHGDPTAATKLTSAAQTHRYRGRPAQATEAPVPRGARITVLPPVCLAGEIPSSTILDRTRSVVPTVASGHIALPEPRQLPLLVTHGGTAACWSGCPADPSTYGASMPR